MLPPRKVKKRAEIDWVVIEEPEMGLHPQAIAVCMLLVLDLLWRGYKVSISTHSPLVLDIVWAIRRLGEHGRPWSLLAQAFGVAPSPEVRRVMEHALACDYRVHFLDLNAQDHRVVTRDISGLDPGSANETEAGWGGLTGYSSRFGSAVRAAVNESDQD